MWNLLWIEGRSKRVEDLEREWIIWEYDNKEKRWSIGKIGYKGKYEKIKEVEWWFWLYSKEDKEIKIEYEEGRILEE
jgi:hypothetical protein